MTVTKRRKKDGVEKRLLKGNRLNLFSLILL
jgi:hypothetical protein